MVGKSANNSEYANAERLITGAAEVLNGRFVLIVFTGILHEKVQTNFGVLSVRVCRVVDLVL